MIRERRARAAAFALCAAILTAATSAPAPAAAQRGVNRAYLDTTCAPCRDFFTYANGA